MQHDSSTLPPHLAALFAQIAATEARLAQLDRELAAIRAGRLRDPDPPRRSVPDVEDALATEGTIVDVGPLLRVIAAPPGAMEADALLAPPPPQRGFRPLRQPSRPAKKHQHSHHRGH